MSQQETERKLKICVIFDDQASAISAKMMIRHVAVDYEYETQAFHFDQLDGAASGIAAARTACETDILVFAILGHRSLPSHIRLWIGLCLGMRDDRQEGALVALFTETEKTKGPDAAIVEYLETVATIGGLVFFTRRRTVRDNSCTGAHGKMKVFRTKPTGSTSIRKATSIGHP